MSAAPTPRALRDAAAAKAGGETEADASAEAKTVPEDGPAPTPHALRDAAAAKAGGETEADALAGAKTLPEDGPAPTPRALRDREAEATERARADATPPADDAAQAAPARPVERDPSPASDPAPGDQPGGAHTAPGAPRQRDDADRVVAAEPPAPADGPALTPRALRSLREAAGATAAGAETTDGPATPADAHAMRDATPAEAGKAETQTAPATGSRADAPAPPDAPVGGTHPAPDAGPATAPADVSSAGPDDTPPDTTAPDPATTQTPAVEAGAVTAAVTARKADAAPLDTGPVPSPRRALRPASRPPPARPADRRGPRVAVVAHSHPRLRAGGGEIAAWRQFDALRQLGVDAWFVGVAPGEDGRLLGGGPGHVAAFGEQDVCIRALPMDGFIMEHSTQAAEDRMVGLLDQIVADVYHFHHVWNIGAGTIRRLRARHPDATFVLTLHELGTICALDGQMVKSTGELCFAAGPLSCATCLPGRSPLAVSVRRARMLEMLGMMDVLIAPSRFVASRLEEWGLPPGQVRVIENGLPEALIDPVRAVPGGAEADILSRRFAYFGNATPTKGLGVLVEAAILLAENASAPPVTIEVHGVDAQTLARLVPGVTLPRLLVPRGRYRPQDAVRNMRREGWVIVPSTWWENAPVVIDEARAAVRPVIASNLGGMAEKIAGWGLQFPVGDAASLAGLIGTLAGDGRRWGALAAGVPWPTPLRESLDQWAQACGIALPVDDVVLSESPEPSWPEAAKGGRPSVR